MKHTITPITQFFLVLVGISVSFANPLQAATMPDYERLQPITTNLSAPTAVALDSNENIYVTEASHNRLLVYNPIGEYVKTLSGLHTPISLAVDGEERIFVGNGDTGNVEVYNNDFTLLFKLGTGDGEFGRPNAIALDDTGKVYVADGKEDTIKVYNADNGSYESSFGNSGSADDQFHFPVSIAIDKLAEKLIISDLPIVRSMMGSYIGARIQVFDMNGDFERSFGSPGVGTGKLTKPLGVEVDKEGRIYVTDAYQDVVHVFSSEGTFLGKIDDPTSPVKTPVGIAFDNSERLFIASLTGSKVNVYRITDTVDAFMTVSPPSHDFDGVDVGTSVAQTFTVFNTGDGDLVIDPITLTGPEAAEFLLQNDNCSDQTIAPSGSCTVEAVFSPVSEGLKSATLSIPSKNPDKPPYEILLTAYISDTSPTTDFTGSPTNGIAPFGVDFSDNSMAYDQPLGYEWDFDNNGTIDSTAQNPSYTYTDPGTYTVKLTVTDSDGSTNTLIRTNYITVAKSHTVTVHTTNNGRVTSFFSAGINCGTDCTETYEEGTVVMLTAVPAASFIDWAGDGCNRAAGNCTLVLYADMTITATFALSTDPGPGPDPGPGAGIPEPGTLLLLGSGLIGILVFGRRTQKQRNSGRREGMEI